MLIILLGSVFALVASSPFVLTIAYKILFGSKYKAFRKYALSVLAEAVATTATKQKTAIDGTFGILQVAVTSSFWKTSSIRVTLPLSFAHLNPARGGI